MPYLLTYLLFSRVSGTLGLLAPALNNVMAGCLRNLLLEHSQYFGYCINHQFVQGADDQIVNKTDEAGEVRNRVGLD